MSLLYPKLSRKATKKLYEVFLKRTTTEMEKSRTAEFEVRPKEIMRFAKSHFDRLEESGMATWNGRYVQRLHFRAA